MNPILRKSFFAFRVFVIACLLASLAVHPVWASGGGGSPDPSDIPVLQALRVQLDGLDQDFLALTGIINPQDLPVLKQLADELARIDAHFALVGPSAAARRRRCLAAPSQDAAPHAGDRAHADRTHRLRVAGGDGAGVGSVSGVHGALPTGVPCPRFRRPRSLQRCRRSDTIRVRARIAAAPRSIDGRRRPPADGA